MEKIWVLDLEIECTDRAGNISRVAKQVTVTSERSFMTMTDHAIQAKYRYRVVKTTVHESAPYNMLLAQIQKTQQDWKS